MNHNDPNDPLDRLVQQSFEASVPADTRRALQQKLEAARKSWPSEAQRTHPILRLCSAHPGMAWLALAACLLLIVLGGTHLALNHPAARATAPVSSYACAAAFYPVSSAVCTAVFYSKEDPKVWVERHMVVLDPQGNMTEIIVYNQERS